MNGRAIRTTLASGVCLLVAFAWDMGAIFGATPATPHTTLVTVNSDGTPDLAVATRPPALRL